MRDRQVSIVRSPAYHDITAQILQRGNSSYFMPKIIGVYDEHDPDHDELHHLAQARLLCEAEAARLAAPTPIWHATADMTSLALAIAKTPPIEPANPGRLPSESGFIVFDEPIGGTTASIHNLTNGLWDLVRRDLTITTPVIAAAWSTWKATGDGPGVQWYRRSPFGVGLPVEASFEGVWVHFYTEVRDLYGQLEPDEPLWTHPSGEIVTAAQVFEAQKHAGTPQLEMHADIVLRWGSHLPAAPKPDSRQEWLNVLYTCWQLLSQRSTPARTPLLQVEHLAPRRKHNDGESGVRVVRVHPDYRPSMHAAARDAALSTGRRAGSCEYRWPVPPHRRSVCRNPAGHHLDPEECTKTTHVDTIVMPHINGPVGKPLRIRPRVRKWDRQPGDHAAD
ncbi:hypothetical protein SAMN05421507_14025 [Lentzea jiangxiensis]|uniref:Uncharacterized protein n=2 Tax=Lentzea jiangxiensis TaxID=641025 RepID=A0A1H0X6D0_9PSEU|nr:hypothetical protein SAMN05421507_14025 [Lentzea jiangxiensis]